MPRPLLTPENAPEVLAKWGEYIKQHHDLPVCDELNTLLDDIKDEDGFGTEGQCDPRGDWRELDR